MQNKEEDESDKAKRTQLTEGIESLKVKEKELTEKINGIKHTKKTIGDASFMDKIKVIN